MNTCSVNGKLTPEKPLVRGEGNTRGANKEIAPEQDATNRVVENDAENNLGRKSHKHPAPKGAQSKLY